MNQKMRTTEMKREHRLYRARGQKKVELHEEFMNRKYK